MKEKSSRNSFRPVLKVQSTISTVLSQALTPVLSLLLLFTSTNSVAAEEVEIFVPFESYYRQVETANYDDYLKLPNVKVASPESFEQMRKHILNTYLAVEVRHTFVLTQTGHTDCINMHTQPSLRQGSGFRPIASTPKVAIFDGDFSSNRGTPVPPMLSDQVMDKFGNIQACPSQFIPMARIELSDLVGYEMLSDFFNKFGETGKRHFPTPTNTDTDTKGEGKS